MQHLCHCVLLCAWKYNIDHVTLAVCSWMKVRCSSLDVNTLAPRQNGREFPDDISKYIFLNENSWIAIEISLKFVPKGPNNNIPSLVQIMAWRRSGDKPLSEPMMVRLPTHISSLGLNELTNIEIAWSHPQQKSGHVYWYSKQMAFKIIKTIALRKWQDRNITKGLLQVCCI